MIYIYEALLLKFLNSVIPELKLLTYAKQDTMFNAMSEVTVYPAAFYYREPTNWEFNKVFEAFDENNLPTKFVPFEQVYHGRIVLDSQRAIMQVASRLRFYWNEHPYLFINWPNSEDYLKVALRLLYIKIDEDRTSVDKKGPLRYVDFSWRSDLFMSLNSDEPTSLVEKVRIYLNPKNAKLSIELNENIIKIIE